MEKAYGTKTLRIAGALSIALGLMACGDDDGDTTDTTTIDMGPMTGEDMGPMTGEDMGPMTDPDMFVEPGCEDITCVNGTCDASGAEPLCVCDAGWSGDTCEDLDAPAAADTVLWLDAADPDTFTFDGAEVIRWADKSPEEADFVSDAASTRPRFSGVIGSRSAVSFDGDDVLTSDGYGGLADELRYTAFFVVSSVADANILAGYSGANERLKLEDTNSGFGVAYTHTVPADADAIFSGDAAYTVGDVHLITVQRTNQETSMWINGGNRLVLPASTPEAIPSAIDLVLGSDAADANTGGLGGLVGEVIIFPTNLDLESRREVESYLSEKWFAAPANHDVTSLGNTTWWLDATDADSVFVPDGETAVAVWSSKLGDGNFSQEDAGRRPLPVADGINGLPVVRFDGDDDRLVDPDSELLSAAEYTVAFVGRSAADSNGNLLYGVNGVNAQGFGLSTTTDGEIRFNHTWPAAALEFNTVTATGGTAGEPFAAIVVWDGVEQQVLTDFGSASAGNGEDAIGTANFTLGAGPVIGSLDGDIGEVIVFERALTAAEQARLLELLQEKWGI